MDSMNLSFIEIEKCPICLNFLNDLVSLKCGHKVCSSCNMKKEEESSCPDCRLECSENMPRPLVSLAEKPGQLKLAPKEKESKLHCEEHQEELKLFCETDKELICVICRDSQEHREHHCIPIKEAVKICKEQVKSSFCSLMGKKSAVLETERQQKQRISQIKTQRRSLHSHITSEFAQMHQFLTEKEQCLIRDLREEEEKILKRMEDNLRDIQENLNSIQEKLSKLEKQLEQKDEVIFLKEEASRKRRISDEQNVLTAADGALTVERITGPLQYRIWREMLDALKPGPASLTLDPNTATPGLIVSEDRKSVRRKSLQLSSSRTTQSFDRWAYVLGSEGFTSGKHYWEVDVGIKTIWCLGVSHGQARGSLGIEGGYWTVCLSPDRGYIASSSLSLTPFTPIVKLQKIGVFLDYEGGQVSFYSVDNMSHLHTFMHTFTERIFPFFSPGLTQGVFSSTMLTICGIKSSV